MNAFLRSLKWTAAAALFVCLSMPAAAQDFRVADSSSTTNTFLRGQESKWEISFTTEGVDGDVSYTSEHVGSLPDWLSIDINQTNALCFIVGKDTEVGTYTVSVKVSCSYTENEGALVAENTFSFTFIIIDETTVTPQICGQGWGWNATESTVLTNKSRWILAEKDAGYVGFFLDATNAIGWTAKDFAYSWENVSGEQGEGVATLSVEHVSGGKGGTSTISCEINYSTNGVSSSTRTNDAWRVSVRNPPTFDGDYMLEVFDDDGNTQDTLMERARFEATFMNTNDTAGVEKWSLLPYPIKKVYAESSAGSTFNPTNGTPMGWQADEGFWLLDISKLNFPFYGNVYTTLWIDSNGRILLGDSDSYGYGDVIDVLFGDLTTEGGNIYVDTNATDRVTIRWKAKYVQGGTPVNASATLHSDGRIVLAYGEGNAGGGAIGLHSGIRDLDSGSLLEHPSKSGSGSMAKAKDIVFTPGNVNTYGGIKIARNGSAERRTKSVSDRGVLSGEFATFGTYNFVVVARGDYGATARSVSFDVAKNPAIRPEPTCDPAVGDINLEGVTNQTFTVTATTSSKVTFTWSLDGATTQSETKTVDTSTPSDVSNSFDYVAKDFGSHTIRCEIRDDDDPENITSFAWRVFSFVFEGGDLPGVMEGYDLDKTFPIQSATGPYTLTFDGGKPEWLRALVEKGGTIGDLYRLHFAGKPDSGDAGTYTFTTTVANAFGDEVAAEFTVAVEENPNKRPVVTRSPNRELMVLAVSTDAVTNSVKLIADAEDPNEEDTLAYSWSVPEGKGEPDGPAFTFHSDTEGKFTVRCDVTDGFWTNEVSWLVLVGDYPVIDTEDPLGDAREGESYSSTLEGHGGNTPYAWSILPYAEMSDTSSYAEVGSPAFRDENRDDLTGFGFRFPFAGEEYNKLRINPNGTITFGDDSFLDAATGDPDADRATFLSHPMIAVLWGELDATVYVACENDTCTISWRGTYVANDAPVNVSATLYADGRIVLSYGEGNRLGGFIGISMGDGKTCLEPLWSLAGSMNKADDMIFIPSRLPTGLGLGEADGVLSGTPSDAGEFTFGVCLTDAEGRTATKNFTLNVAEVIPENTYRVYFEANGGSGEMKPQTLECGESVALSTSSFTRMGHVFDGWATSEDGDVVYADGATVVDLVEAGKRITLWAKWKAGAYAIAFDANGGEGEMDSLSRLIGESAALPANAFTRVGFLFKGWATEDAGEVVYADAATVQNLAATGERITLYAVWEAAVSAITLDSAGGTGGTATVSVRYGDAMPTIAAPVLTGYSFGGYFTEAGGAGTQYYTADGASARAWDGTADVTLHAWWIPTQYTVTFNANGGEGWIADQLFVYGTSQVLTENDFTRKGYVFIGWALSSKGAVAFGDEEWVQNLSADGETVTLYAKWAKKSYKVKFYANGGKGTMKTLSMTYGKAKKLTANKFKRDGYKFKGWATSKKLAKKGKVAYKNKKKVKNLTTTGKTVKLYAVWKKRR